MECDGALALAETGALASRLFAAPRNMLGHGAGFQKKKSPLARAF